MKTSTPSTRVPILLYTLAGTLICVLGLMQGDMRSVRQFWVYLICSVIAVFGLKLNGAQGLLSAGILVLALGVKDLSLPELFFIALTITLLGELRNSSRRPRLESLLFALANATIGIAVAQMAYRLFSYLKYNALFPAPAIACFLALLLNYQLSITLRDRPKSFRDFYKTECRPLLPWFVAAAYVAHMVQRTAVESGLDAAVLVLPILFTFDQGHRLWSATSAQHAAELAAHHQRTMETLALAIDSRDHTTQNHLRRLQFYARAVGEEMGLPETHLRDLQVAALLHDIGKLGIPDHILLKPGPLSPEEWEKMKTHPVTGAAMLSRMHFPESVLAIVQAHHEKWDGSGYPLGLAGEEIAIGARILSAVDCLDALVSDRPYRSALPLQEAMDFVRAEKGKSFDPAVVAVLERRYLEFERTAWAGSTSGILGDAGEPSREDVGTFETTLRTESGSSSILDPIVSARQETQMLQQLAGNLAHATHIDEVTAAVHTCLSRLIRYDTLVIYSCSADKMEPLSVAGNHSHLFSRIAFPVKQGLSGRAVQYGATILNGDASEEACYVNDSAVFYRLQSALAAPLRGRDGISGVLTLYHPDRNAFSRDDVRLLEAATTHVGMAVESAVRYKNAEELAVTDHVTGIANARSLALHLQREVEKATRENTGVGVLVCDLDGFKQVNDRFGHLKGNEVLQQVAKGLRHACRATDYLARLGGDEFVIVVPGMTQDVYPAYVERLRAVAIEAGWEVCGEPCISMSVGGATYPADGNEPEALLSQADYRMYRAKEQYKMAAAVQSS